jgi:hypothetical protein
MRSGVITLLFTIATLIVAAAADAAPCESLPALQLPRTTITAARIVPATGA